MAGPFGSERNVNFVTFLPSRFPLPGRHMVVKLKICTGCGRIL